MTGISENIDNASKHDLSQENHNERSSSPTDATVDQGSAEPVVQDNAVHPANLPAHKKRMPFKGEIKCMNCINNKSGQPEIVLEQQGASGLLSIRFSGHCGSPCRVIINRNFELIDHSCASFKSRNIHSDSFDFEEFLDSDKEIDDVLLENSAEQLEKPAQKLVTMEESMKVAVKKLAKPLALLIPTTAQRKTEEQLRAEREQRMKELIGTEVNLIYLRVLEFEKLASGNNTYSLDKFSKALKDLDKGSIIGFIKMINNDFLIAFNEKAQAIRFFNLSKPEQEILSREFEKWLRFNRL